MKKIIRVLTVFLFLLLIVSCDVNGGGSSVKPIKIIISQDKALVLHEDSAQFTVDSVSEAVDEQSITWYVDGIKQDVNGSSFSFTTPANSGNESIRYKIKAVVTKNNKKFSSNVLYLTATDYLDIAQVVRNYIAEEKFSAGVSVSVYSKTNNIDFSINEGSDNDSSTLHLLCSITKSFTASAILKMVEDNVISLDATIEDLLPEYLAKFDLEKINKDATVLQLMNHRSGISDFINADMLLDLISRDITIPGYSNPYYSKGKKNWKPEIAVNYASDSVASKVGGSYPYIYSTVNYVILGMIVDKYCGTSYESYIRTNFLEPLELNDTGVIWIPPREKAPFGNVADANIDMDYYYAEFISGDSSYESLLSLFNIPKTGIYNLSKKVPHAQEMLCDLAWSGGGMVSTSRPVALWCYNIVSENGYSDSSYFDAIRTQRLTALQSQFYYGAVENMTYYGNDYICHYGEGPGTYNIMAYSPELDTSFVILTDCSKGSFDLKELLNKLYDVVETSYVTQ